MNEPQDNSEVDLQAFALQVRQFVRTHLPVDLRETVRSGRPPEREQLVRWNEILAAAGWLVPHWPTQWGGQGWPVAQQMVFDEEMCLNDAPELNSVTFDMIGPVLARSGSPWQQQTFLPAIASGRQWWCQGYSEPNAGSDLASLRTSAARGNSGDSDKDNDNDFYLVNGSKIWTSYAQYADWMFCLVRTSTEGKPQAGISFLLIDMHSPGVTVRPIRGIHGWDVFCEVFLDNVRVPLHHRVGQENEGWAIAKSLLEFERLKLARIGENKRRRARALAAAKRVGALEQASFRRRYAILQARLLALEANALRFIARSQAGEKIGAEVSMLKMRGSRLIQQWEELIVDTLGAHALVNAGASVTNTNFDTNSSACRFLARGYTIAGGSSEIQHNVIAKQVLGL
jgi:acyl-CoA dehydrogenase